MIRPIPKRLLIHSVTYEEYKEDDGYGDSFADPIEIKNVRVEPKSAIARSNIREDIEGSTLLFLDRRHSSPFLRPVERSRITFNGRRYEVSSVDEFYADSDVVHHLEVTLT